MINALRARLHEHGAGYWWTERHGEPVTVILVAVGDRFAVVPGHVGSGDGRHRLLARFDSQGALARWLAESS